MQCVEMTLASPITPVKGRIAFIENSSGDRRVVFFGHDDENVVGQMRAQSLEKALVEVGERAPQHECPRNQGVDE